MLLGERLPGAYTDWRLVEADLYEIARRVKEYDRDARLVRQDGSGHLGLARYVRDRWLGSEQNLTLARAMHDLTTDLPLTGEPDPRVIRCQRSYDAWRFKDIRQWNERMRVAHHAREAREDAEVFESYGDHSERFVHALRKDVTTRPRTYFRDREAAA